MGQCLHAHVALMSSTQFMWMEIGSFIDIQKFQGKHFTVHLICFTIINIIRGSRKQYYDGAFIVANEAVDSHLSKIGYTDSQVNRYN